MRLDVRAPSQHPVLAVDVCAFHSCMAFWIPKLRNDALQVMITIKFCSINAKSIYLVVPTKEWLIYSSCVHIKVQHIVEIKSHQNFSIQLHTVLWIIIQTIKITQNSKYYTAFKIPKPKISENRRFEIFSCRSKTNSTPKTTKKNLGFNHFRILNGRNMFANYRKAAKNIEKLFFSFQFINAECKNRKSII